MKLQKVHDFKERLQFSEQASHEGFWGNVYKKAFPDLEFAILCAKDGQGQRLGIDRIFYLKSGKILSIDEKKREKEYPDILLEYISVDNQNKPGWIEKPLLIDYLAYAFMPSQRCYLFPWQMLRRAWLHFKEQWIKDYRKIEAQNKGYKTISVAVPINIVVNAVKNAMIIQL